MKNLRAAAVTAPLALLLAITAAAGTLKCPPDAAKVGPTCVDKYEASVWQIPPTSTALIKRVQIGRATLADLTGSGAVQLGCTGTPYNHTPYPAGFPADGNWTPVFGSIPPSPGVYAASIPGVLPTACTTWFQAEEACALSGKRLLTNQEWQRAAAGTPDPGSTPGALDCNTNSSGPSNTGDRTNCASSWGVLDMIGNVDEWVADWVPRSTDCPGWGSFSDDFMCLSGASTTDGPGAVVRGGLWLGRSAAGVFAVFGGGLPSFSVGDIGFRCAR